ncbi:hypothetical protein [Legionella resiliens]|uniref:Uncharacterized protein n=1 Tax=Legionella resiliens TaxID=2905958 RepID=A0ABS8X3A6_9GAMM|nr:MULTISPECIES: hypothetical protein [unclassified Legionella]MCE0722429.1 hypothetical protein [Legionella sp. 9fVS26]MCE3531583.1 hypothetical protein [Legionella sp. 8cVS16]
MSKNKPLKDYQQKRDFRKTKEPQGGTSKKKENIFVIQKHDARHLHYEFSLPNDDVLISWAAIMKNQRITSIGLSPVLLVKLVLQKWTRHGKLRHPRFLGLRKDKDAKDVRREDQIK